jgi:hypothetical protein
MPLPSGGGATPAAATAAPAAASASAPAPATGGGSGGELGGGIMDFATSEGGGRIIAGLGSGLASWSQAEAQREAALERDRKAHERVSGNYRTAPSRGLLRTNAATADAAGPAAAVARPAGPPGGRYRYNRDTGQIEFT